MKRVIKILIGIILISGLTYIGEIALRYVSKDYGHYVKEKTWNRLKEYQLKTENKDTTENTNYDN